MNDTPTLYRAPIDSGSLVLGRTLPSLLDEACTQVLTQPDSSSDSGVLHQWHRGEWQSLSLLDFRRGAEEFALGMMSLGLARGDRVALVMHSDTHFAIADMGCLLAGLVDVPIDLTQTIENVLFILQHTAAKVLVVSNQELLDHLLPYFWATPELKRVVVATSGGTWTGGMSLEEVQARGREQWSVEGAQELRDAIASQDLATILYIASETKRPRGVMLTHENITANVLAAFSSYPNLQRGPEEVALLFLPLTHIFARVFLYGHLAYGHRVYFSDASHLVKHLRRVKPTFLITVPRLLEKIHERILEKGRHLNRSDQAVFNWALRLAQRFEPNRLPHRPYALRMQLADRLVFAQWRAVFGGRLKACICGGAALSGDLVRFFSAAGVPVLQGYGLTETSGVLSFNRGSHHRVGSVGLPITGVEVTLAPDQEILVRAPFVMQGYYQDSEATNRVIDAEGWLHTGDLGKISADGFLTITGVKKSLFKLSTGKYVSPLPLEQALMRSPLVAHALTVGMNRKFCGMLIFPNLEALYVGAEQWNIDATKSDWLHHPRIWNLYQSLIDTANCHLPYWSTVRKFALLEAELTEENGLLLPDGTLNRMGVMERFAEEIEVLYGSEREVETQTTPSKQEGQGTREVREGEEWPLAGSSCPTYARSLMHY
ncbi:MAG TPA: long-chain fatty acid--CoA ligase [Trichocoleus sp.]